MQVLDQQGVNLRMAFADVLAHRSALRGVTATLGFSSRRGAHLKRGQTLFSFLVAAGCLSAVLPVCAETRYEKSFFILHEDHHIFGDEAVGREADVEATARLVALCKPDMVQMHAKGNPGWTTYPTKVGYAPTNLVGDVLGVWRDVARRGGYGFGVYFNLGNDGRIASLQPHWIRKGPDGKPLGRSLCFHSGVAEKYLWPMIREVLATYHPDSFWFDGTAHTVRPCYCAPCRARFEREKHLPPPKTEADIGWADYHEMQRQIFREFIAQTIKEIHTIEPHCLVGFNNAYHLMMPEKPPQGIGYLTSDIGNSVESLSPLAHWLDAQCLPYDLMTKFVVADPQSVKGDSATAVMPKPAGQLQQEMAVVIANGGRYSLWDIPSPAGALRREWIEAMARDVAPFLRARQPWCLGSRLPDAAVLHSAAAHYAATRRAQKSFVVSDRHIDGATVALSSRHVNYELLPDWRLAEQDLRSPLLIVEDPEAVTEAVAAGILAFLEKGGRVLWSGMGLTAQLQSAFGVNVDARADKPEPLIVGDEPPGATFERPLHRVSCTAAQTLMQVRTPDGKRFPLLTKNAVGRGTAFYAPVPLLSRFEGRPVPSTLVDKVIGMVLPPSERRLATDAPAHVEAVLRERDGQQVVHLVNLAEGKRTTSVYDASVLYPGVKKDGQRAFRPDRLITEIPAAPACRVSLRLAARPASVMLQPQNQPVAGWTFENGRLEIDVPAFAIHQMVVVKPDGV